MDVDKGFVVELFLFVVFEECVLNCDCYVVKFIVYLFDGVVLVMV